MAELPDMPWTFRVRCPHGREGWAKFDDLTYACRPVECDHPNPPPPVTVTQSASKWKEWRAVRRARRQLKGW